MRTRSARNSKPGSSFTLGRKSYAAISAVEGLKLDEAGELRLERTRRLGSDERRAATIRAFRKLQKHG